MRAGSHLRFQVACARNAKLRLQSRKGHPLNEDEARGDRDADDNEEGSLDLHHTRATADRARAVLDPAHAEHVCALALLVRAGLHLFARLARVARRRQNAPADRALVLRAPPIRQEDPREFRNGKPDGAAAASAEGFARPPGELLSLPRIESEE
jgi:hypothetical protein